MLAKVIELATKTLNTLRALSLDFLKMKSKSTKRLENKKKKMAALLEITKLNEYDRSVKHQSLQQVKESEVSQEAEPSPKRARTEAEALQPSADLGPSGKPRLSGDDLKELKKMLREKTLKLRQQPTFRLRDMGANASLSTDTESRVPLFISDLQHLIMYTQLGHHSPYSPARWCALEKFNRLQATNVLIIENFTMSHFISHENVFPFLSSNFEHKLEILAPNVYNSDVVKDISMVPLTGTQVKRFMNEFGTLESAVLKSCEVFDTVRNLFPIESKSPTTEGQNGLKLPQSDLFPRTQLLLSGWQMVEENFPLPIKGLMERKYSNYILSKDRYEDVTPFSPMFGVDCEMCKTTSGDLELTRVSVVDESFNTFYDKLVKPDNKITDYLTRFSGITHKMMKNINTRLRDVQEDLRRILPSDAILVGQSLGNDLHALKMMHPYVIDTSVIFNITGDRARKTKLKTLTQEFLSERIQESKSGHCSMEDSKASLKLTQLKLRKSLYFGDAVMGGLQNEIRACPELGTYNFATSMLKQVTKMDKTASVVGLDDVAAKYKYYVDKGKSEGGNGKIRCVSERSCKDVVRGLCDVGKLSSLNIGHVKVQDGHAESVKVCKNVDRWVREVFEAMPAPGLMVVLFTGTEGCNGGCFIQMKRGLV